MSVLELLADGMEIPPEEMMGGDAAKEVLVGAHSACDAVHDDADALDFWANHPAHWM